MRSTFIQFAIIFWMSISTLQAQEKPVIKSFTFSETSYINKLSDNGRWGAAYGSDENNSTLENYPYLLDIVNHKSISLLTDDEKSASLNCGAHDVSDDGKMVVGTYNGKPAYCQVNDDGCYTWKLLPLPAGKESYYGFVTTITPDGSCMVGTLYNSGDVSTGGYEEYPIMWKDGAVVELPGMPNANDDTGTIQLNRLIDLSADGKTIVGCLAYIYPSYTQSYVYDIEKKTYTIIGKDIPELEKGHISSASLSPNGEWVSGTAYTVVEVTGSDFPDEQSVPYRYNVSTGEFTLYNEKQDYGIGGFAVADNGLTTMATPLGSPMRSTMFRINGYYYDLDLILSERYGMNFITASGYTSTGTPVTLSADGRTLGVLVIQEGNYVITFPETIEEAAKSVNLLAKASISPATGSSFTNMRTITVTFDKAPTIVAGATAALYKEGNETPLRSSLSIQPAEEGDNCLSFNINFRPTQMEEGVKYTVTIPAGCFRLGTTDTYNREMSITYIGRKNAPVSMIATNLENGSEVASLSYSAPINLTFDTQIKLVDGTKAALYQEGVNAAIDELTLATSSNMLAVYPATKRNLFRDVNYTVKIPAGAVTDIMGEHGNEEITFNYIGIYIPEAPADTLLFADDFADPSTSFNNFMRYEGDHNTHNATAKGWGFDADNQPWYFGLRENEETSDYCAGASSMHSPAGQADDWMVTNQLYLPNQFCYLAFDVQSYLKSKEDHLKVYIWTNEAVYSTMNEEIINRIKSEGTCIYDEVETPGESEENLSGDWKHRIIPLEQYAGQYVYIAFVNQNNNQSALFIDNIEVIYKSSCLLALNTEPIVVNESEITINGVVRITDETNTYDHIKVYYSNEEQTASDTITASGLSLKKGDIYDFDFTRKMPLTVGKENRLTVSVVLGGSTKSTEFVIKDLSFEPTKRVVIEEGTGTWCTNCPDGLVALKHIEESFPDRIIPIGIHYNDIYDFNDYVGALGITAYPTARVNRRSEIVSPLFLDMSTLSYSFTSEAGNETFMDLTLSELNEEAEADITFNEASFDMGLNRLTLDLSVKYALDKSGVAANIFCVLMEDNLTGIQQNGRANNPNPIYGDWGKNGIYGGQAAVTYTFKDVARSILASSIDGTPGYIPANVTNGVDIPVQMEFTLPSTVTDYKQAKVACMLIDANTGRVINANVTSLTDANPAGIAGTETTCGVQVIPTQKGIQVTWGETASQATIQLFDCYGTLLNQLTTHAASAIINTQGYQGVAIVKVTSPTQQAVQKVMIQ